MKLQVDINSSSDDWNSLHEKTSKFGGNKFSDNELNADVFPNVSLDGQNKCFSNVQYNNMLAGKYATAVHGPRPDILQNKNIIDLERLPPDLPMSSRLLPSIPDTHNVHNVLPHIIKKQPSSETYDKRSLMYLSRSFQLGTSKVNNSNILTKGQSLFSKDFSRDPLDCVDALQKESQPGVSHFTKTSLATISDSSHGHHFNTDIRSTASSNLSVIDQELLFDVPTNFPPPPVRKKTNSFFSRTASRFNRKQSFNNKSSKRLFPSKSKGSAKEIAKFRDVDRGDIILKPPLKFSSNEIDLVTVKTKSNLSRNQEALDCSLNNYNYDEVSHKKNQRESTLLNCTPLNGFQLLKTHEYNNFQPGLVSSSKYPPLYLQQSSDNITLSIQETNSCNGKSNGDFDGFDTVKNQQAQLAVQIPVASRSKIIANPMSKSATEGKIHANEVTNQYEPQNDTDDSTFFSNLTSNNDGCDYKMNEHTAWKVSNNLLIGNFEKESLKTLIPTTLYSPIPVRSICYDFRDKSEDFADKSHLRLDFDKDYSNISSPESITPSLTPTQFTALLSPQHLSQPQINTVSLPLISSFEKCPDGSLIPLYSCQNSQLTQVVPTDFVIDHPNQEKYASSTEKNVCSAKSYCVSDVMIKRREENANSSITFVENKSNVLCVENNKYIVSCTENKSIEPCTENTENNQYFIQSRKVKDKKNNLTVTSNVLSNVLCSQNSKDFIVPPKNLNMDTSAIAAPVKVRLCIPSQQQY